MPSWPACRPSRIWSRCRSAPAPEYTCYTLRLTSIGPYRIFGYYSVPTGPGAHPGLLLTPRYGSVNHVPDYTERKRYAVLQIMHRGQRLADQPFAAAYPGLLTHGIDDPTTYIYRGIVADCLRAAEFLASRPEVDPSRDRRQRRRAGDHHGGPATGLQRGPGDRLPAVPAGGGSPALRRLPNRGAERLRPRLP